MAHEAQQCARLTGLHAKGNPKDCGLGNENCVAVRGGAGDLVQGQDFVRVKPFDNPLRIGGVKDAGDIAKVEVAAVFVLLRAQAEAEGIVGQFGLSSLCLWEAGRATRCASWGPHL